MKRPYNGFPWFLRLAGAWHKILDWVESYSWQKRAKGVQVSYLYLRVSKTCSQIAAGSKSPTELEPSPSLDVSEMDQREHDP